MASYVSPTVLEHPRQMSEKLEMDHAARILHNQEMYRCLSHENLLELAKICKKETFQKGELLLKEAEETDKAYFLAEGHVVRFKTQNEQEKILEEKAMGTSINSLHHLGRDEVFASARCESATCVAYSLTAEKLESLLQTNPSFAREVVLSLQREVRNQSKVVRSFRTPLLETQQRQFNIPAVTIAAGVESYYRSAMNAFINYSLTGKRGELFPNMGVQVPSRITYILGFKSLRYYADHKINYDRFSNPDQARLGAALIPGIVMCPVSSLLEASNAGHLNPEPLTRRWTRGFAPRVVREVVFGVGLNQLSDVMEERIQGMLLLQNPYLANALGSLSAGVVSGYLSHVPHNMSTLRLMHPSTPYSQLFKQFVAKSLSERISTAIEQNVPKPAVPFVKTVLAIIFPRGCLVRTTQIVGTFTILNGTINLMSQAERKRVETAVRHLRSREEQDHS